MLWQHFSPYLLQRISHWKPTPADAIPTAVDVQPLLQLAVASEDRRFEQGANDSEDLGVSSRPASPLTESESEDNVFDAPEFNASDQPTPNVASTSVPIEKRHRNAAASQRRMKKRVKSATSGHGPHTYAANPSMATHHAEELPPLNVPIDAEHFPASGLGAWVGKRKQGAKKMPWTVPELLQNGFKIIEWDGQ
jgi:hypothetical protein